MATIESLTKLITEAFCVSRDDISFRDRPSKARLVAFLVKGDLPGGATPPQALAQHQERMSGLIEALEFYADRESYRVETDILNEDYPVMADQGDTAREALDALKKGN